LPYTSIKTLHLGGNRFGNDGVLALAEQLPGCQIDELGLEENEIEMSAVSALGAAWVKRPFSDLRLNGNKISQAQLARFYDTLRSIL